MHLESEDERVAAALPRRTGAVLDAVPRRSILAHCVRERRLRRVANGATKVKRRAAAVPRADLEDAQHVGSRGDFSERDAEGGAVRHLSLRSGVAGGRHSEAGALKEPRWRWRRLEARVGRVGQRMVTARMQRGGQLVQLALDDPDGSCKKRHKAGSHSSEHPRPVGRRCSFFQIALLVMFCDPFVILL